MDSETRTAIVLVDSKRGRPVSLTHRKGGERRFGNSLSESTALERTYQRVALAFPPQRTLTVMTRAHRRFYEGLLRDALLTGLIVQPRDRGSAPAIVHALLRLQKDNPNAAVAIFPSHHYVEDDAALMRYVDLAFEGVRARPDLVVLLGMTPDGPEVDYCWIETGDRVVEYWRLFRVRRFWEKPTGSAAIRLWQAGCVWSSSVFIANLAVLLVLVRKVFPQLTAAFDDLRAVIGSSNETEVVETIYSNIADQDFTREIAAHRPRNLAVLPVTGVEWRDLGKPRRIITGLHSVRVRPG